MLKFYHTNLLTVTELTEYGAYAESEEYVSIPLRATPEGTQIGDNVEAFIYLDGADEVFATMEQPYVQIGKCAYLEVVSSGERGTFLDWGLPKDLLLPFSEQIGSVRSGDFCFVYVYQDENSRPVASMKLHRT